MNPSREANLSTVSGLAEPGRRLVLGAAGVLALASLHCPLAARVLEDAGSSAPPPTPRLTDGPFYPVAFDRNPTTTLIVGPLQASARPLHLSGRVVDRGGRPIAGARVEIWQCDALQHYRHPADAAAGAVDRGFAGFGWQLGGADGRYAFETIRPVPYPGRTPHIHVKVRLDGRTLLSSQIFMPDQEPLNRADFLWRNLGRDGQPLALATLERGGERESARFDIVVG
jgi:protocatechuate 3,4-dioxygenase beta subunit